jgi:hypothetical protein
VSATSRIVIVPGASIPSDFSTKLSPVDITNPTYEYEA